MTEQEQSLRQELEVARNRVCDARDVLAEAEQAQALVMKAIQNIVEQRKVAV